MTTSNVHNEIAKALTKAVSSLVEDYKGSSLTDIYLVVDKDSAELSVFDDEENLLNQRIIDAWMGVKNDEIINNQLREVVEQFDLENKFDSLDLYKPFSISISDENFIVQEELLTIQDDSMIKLDNDFLDNLDKEFDEFLDKLLKE